MPCSNKRGKVIKKVAARAKRLGPQYKFVPLFNRRGRFSSLAKRLGLECERKLNPRANESDMKRKSEVMRLESTPTKLYTSRMSNMSSWQLELGVTGSESKVKWHTLKHNGPSFPAAYVRLPPDVYFYYDSQPMPLSTAAEEAATFYAKLMNADFAQSRIFMINFFHDFRQTLEPQERLIIDDFWLCNFEPIHAYFQCEAERKRRASKEEKTKLMELRELEIEKFGYCEIDGCMERISNFRIEPPGIFRGRGNHPKVGMLKVRIQPEDITINCSPGCIPAPPSGHKWKAVKHDTGVSWLASWKDQLTGTKYVQLNSGARLQCIRDLNKFETARRLAQHIDKIRLGYRKDWHAPDMMIRQRGVALYFIDRLALRAGKEKNDDEADTVGCCTLRVEHLELYEQLEGKLHVAVFNFLGKDSVRFRRRIALNGAVYRNLCHFVHQKQPEALVFHLLTMSKLSEHLKTLMDGLTAKVFRTYNASVLLQNTLDALTKSSQSCEEKLLMYTKANAGAALLCNHQRARPKGFAKALDIWNSKIQAMRLEIARQEHSLLSLPMRRRKAKQCSLVTLRQQLSKMELKRANKEVGNTVALSTSKVNYLDPRISVAWCKKHNVPIEKIFNPTLRNKFKWAIHATNENFRF